MKKLHLIGLGFVFIFLFKLHGAEDLSSQLQTVEQTQLTPASEIPKAGLFYSAKLAGEGMDAPIYPGAAGMSAWPLGGNAWLVDDLNPVMPVQNGMRTLDLSGPPTPPGAGTNGSPGTNTYVFTPMPIDTNLLWLSLSNIEAGVVNLQLHRGSNSVYGIYAANDLLTPWTEWTPVAELWPTNDTTNMLPFTVAASGDMTLYRAMDWTGYEVGGLPAAWVFNWFGNLSECASDWDPAQNETVSDDFNNGVEPNLIDFLIQVTNNYVSSMSAPVQLNINSGVPSYMAISVDDSNYVADASWTPFLGANLNVNLGLNEGWHSIWIGLKGYATNATATWQWKRLKLDYTPPTLVITNPTTSIVDEPVIQLQGYSPEALASISYDLSNALGVVSNQPVYVTDQSYSTSTYEFTTNYFQAFDVPLTNGLNEIALQSTDLAGNVTTTNFNVTLDYSGQTNPPVVQLYWPQDGMQINGESSSFVWRGWVDDPTASVAVQTVNGEGETNVYHGMVGRDGHFYVTVPLESGTNTYALTAQDMAGNVMSTNLTLTQSSVPFQIDSAFAGESLVGGVIEAEGYTVWVNGVKATNEENGTWEAQITPIGAGGGTAEAVAIPNSDNGGNGAGGGAAGNGVDASGNPSSPEAVVAQRLVDPPSGVYINAYHELDDDTANAPPYQPQIETRDWENGVGGSQTESYLLLDSGLQITWPASSWPEPIPDGTEIFFSNDGNSTNSYSPPSFYFPDYHYNVLNSSGHSTADTQLRLAPGGPLGSTKLNLWAIQVDIIYSGTDTNITPQDITVGSLGHPGSNDVLYVMLPDNAPPIDVTPKISGSDYYGFNVTTQEYKLTLMANGQDIGDTDPNPPTFCVGQATTNQAVFNPPLPAGTQTNYHWFASLDFVNLIVPPATNEASTDYVLEPAALTNNPETLWWCSGGYKYLFCTVTLQLPNGQTVALTGQGNVSIDSPVISGFIDEPPSWVTNATVDGGYSLALGDGNSHGDMDYEVKVTSSYSGKIGIVQLINRDASNGSFGSGSLSTDGQYWLDTGNPYTISPINAGMESFINFSDNPYVADVASGLSLTTRCSDLFIDYVIFRPKAGDENNNIYVTLGIVSGGNPSWGWAGSTTWLGSWSTPTGTITRPTKPDNSDAFPSWQHTYQ